MDVNYILEMIACGDATPIQVPVTMDDLNRFCEDRKSEKDRATLAALAATFHRNHLTDKRLFAPVFACRIHNCVYVAFFLKHNGIEPLII